MNKKSIINVGLISLFVVGMLGFLKIYSNNNLKPIHAESTLKKTIDFEDLTSGNMSGTARNISYYDGVIVADGKITKTSSAIIDSNTLGLKIPAETPNDPRIVTIQVSGYTKIVLDLKQSRMKTIISTGCGQYWIGTNNGEIMRDIEIPTYGYHEITLSFYTEEVITAAMDAGIDNIRFYGVGEGSDPSSEPPSTSQNPSSSDNPTSEPIDSSSEEVPVGDYISIRDIAGYLEDKNEHYPLSDQFIEVHQQKSGGYIDLAKKLGLLVDKSRHEPNQKWHFFDSWLYPSIEEGTLSWLDDANSRVYTKLLCPELLLWIYEACEVPEEKIVLAKQAAEEGKIAGTHVSTIAKNMRAHVPWDDIRITVENYKNQLA